MKPEKEELIRDLFDNESRRETTLLAGGRILRRRRFWRAAGQGFALLALVATAMWLAGQQNPRPVPPRVSTAENQPSAAAQVESLTDEQLLALFPHTPVGLVTLSNGKKLLIFPRPGDEKRFVTRI